MSAKGKAAASTRGKGKSGGKRLGSAERAGLAMPVARVTRYMRQGNYASHVARKGGVFMAACLEYCVAEILELAGNACKDNHRKTISPRHVLLAVRNDEELSQLCAHVTVARGGVVPHIHQSLLPEKKKKKASQ